MNLLNYLFPGSKTTSKHWREKVVLELGKLDRLRLVDCHSGLLIVGSSGSGKTTSSASQLAMGLADQPNISFLVLTVKPDEGQRMEALFTSVGVKQPIIRITPGSPDGFDPTTFEMSRSGSALACTQMMSAVLEMNQRSKGMSNSGDPFWMEFCSRIIERAISATFLGEGRTSLRAVKQFIQHLPHSLEEAGSQQWRESPTAKCLQKAEQRPLNPMQQMDHQANLDFVLNEWPKTPDKTKYSCLPMIANLLTRLTTGTIGYFTSQTNLSPLLLTGDEPNILILDYPVLADPVGHRALATLVYMSVVNEALRRTVTPLTPTLVIWQDEYSYLAVPDYDYRVQSVFRSAKIAAVRIIQDFQLLRKSLGGGDQGTMEADAIISNLATWICHSSHDLTTTQAIADRLGKVPVRMRNGSVNLNGFNLIDHAFHGAKPTVNSGWSEQIEYRFRPEALAKFRKGSKANGFMSDALVLTSGNPFASGQNFLQLQFPQVFFS